MLFEINFLACYGTGESIFLNTSLRNKYKYNRDITTFLNNNDMKECLVKENMGKKQKNREI